jgi:hypothetical protein
MKQVSKVFIFKEVNNGVSPKPDRNEDFGRPQTVSAYPYVGAFP